MQVQSVELRDFRSHHRFQADLGGSLTVIAGPNGSGKTNILEGLHFGLTGRSCRTSMDRQVVAWDTDTTIASVSFSSNGVDHILSTALQRSGDKRVQLDGSAIETSVQISDRPTVVVFLPDKLSLVNGAPGERRIHMDRVIGAFTPRMPSLKADYNQALAQRNALLTSSRSTGTRPQSLPAWDTKLAHAGTELVELRDRFIDEISSPVSEIAKELGLSGELELSHRPAASRDIDQYMTDLDARFETDMERGFTSYGPHRGDFLFLRNRREIKSTGSQGEKRIALLSLLLAERELIAHRTGNVPLLLLDDVMSELDSQRRRLLTERVFRAGQCVITATEFAHVPTADLPDTELISLGSDSSQKLRVA